MFRRPSTHSIPSESAELLRSARDMGKEFTIQSSWFRTKLHKSLFMGQCAQWRAAVVHDEWKTCSKKPGVDHTIASVDDLGAYDVAHGNFFHENSQVAILNKNVPMMRVTCDLCRKTEFAPQKPLRPWFRWINSICVRQFLIHSWHRRKAVFAQAVSALGGRIVIFLGDHASIIGPSDCTQKSRHPNYVPRPKSEKRWIQCVGQVWQVQKMHIDWRGDSCWGKLARFKLWLWERLHEVFHPKRCRDASFYKKGSDWRNTRQRSRTKIPGFPFTSRSSCFSPPGRWSCEQGGNEWCNNCGIEEDDAWGGKAWRGGHGAEGCGEVGPIPGAFKGATMWRERGKAKIGRTRAAFGGQDRQQRRKRRAGGWGW